MAGNSSHASKGQSNWLQKQWSNLQNRPEAKRLLKAAGELERGYHATDNMDRLEESLRLARQALALLPEDPEYLTQVARRVSLRYQATSRIQDFHETNQLLRKALDQKPEHIERIGCLLYMCNNHLAGSTRTGRQDYLDESIRLARKATEQCRERELMASCADNLRIGLFLQYSRSGSLDALKEAMQALKRAQKIDVENPKYREILVQYLHHWYQDTLEEPALEQAIQIARSIVDGIPEKHPDRPLRMLDLATYLFDWHQQTGSQTSHQDAIALHRQALRLTRENTRGAAAAQTNTGSYLSKLATCLFEWCRRTRATDDLREVLRVSRRTVDMTPYGSPVRVDRLMAYGKSLQWWTHETGSISELIEAAELVRQVADLAPDDFLGPGRPISTLIHYLLKFYVMTGVEDYLEQSFRITRRAIRMIPKDNPHLSNLMQALALLLATRYAHTRAIADLKESVVVTREVVALTPKNHRYRPNRLYALAERLVAVRGRGKAEAMEAVEIMREAVELTPKQASNPYHILQGLSMALQNLYKETGSREYLEEAIQAKKRAVELAPPSQLRSYLATLASLFYTRYGLSHSLGDLNEAISAARRAMEMQQSQMLSHANVSIRLAVYLIERETKFEGETGFDEGHQLFRLSFEQSNPIFADVLHAGRHMTNYYMVKGQWQDGYDTCKRMLDLVPSMVPQSLQISDKQFMIHFVYGIASDAATAALRLKLDPFVALDMLEQGRGLLGTSLEEMRRTDLSDLQRTHPQLMERFVRLRNELEQPIVDLSSVTIDLEPSDVSSNQQHLNLQGQQLLRPATSDRRFEAAKELSQITAEITKLPGFETFFSAASEEEIRGAASRGPVVVINVSMTSTSGHGSDAIIVESHQIRALPLPDLSYPDIAQKAEEGRFGRPSVLEWLWDTTMNPILKALGYTEPLSETNRPHVWWIPTGLLTMFPLHAAGYHMKRPGDTVLDRVVSSYSSSIKAIIYGRRRSIHSSSSGKALLVAMEHTPQCSSLPFAAKEVAVLSNLCRSMSIDPSDSSRSKSAVLGQLRDCQIFHFAGHGYTDRRDPSQSYLCLEDGPTNSLKVADLLDLNLYNRSPFLAYLSACGTGQVGAAENVDEAMHLISACQLAGFRHVIGTLWEVNDAICVDVARMLYEEMRDGKMSDESVAWGLHQASRTLRDRWCLEIHKTGAERRLATKSIRYDDVGSRPGLRDMRPTSDDREEEAFVSAMERLQRDILDAEDEDEDRLQPPLWVPYVHFGV